MTISKIIDKVNNIKKSNKVENVCETIKKTKTKTKTLKYQKCVICTGRVAPKKEGSSKFKNACHYECFKIVGNNNPFRKTELFNTNDGKVFDKPKNLILYLDSFVVSLLEKRGPLIFK